MALAPYGAPAPFSAPPRPTPARAEPRRRLGPNVICMHADARPAVANAARRGRLPKGIVNFKWLQRIKVGKLYELCGGNSANHGALVRVIQFDIGVRGFDWRIEAVDWPLLVRDLKTGELQATPATTCWTRADHLRRVWLG